MPQPLISKGIKQIILGDTTAARPRHAAAALEIIAEAARAELEVGYALISLSPENGRRLAAHYSSQENDARKGATVEAIAAVLLSEDDEDLLHRLLKRHRSLQKERTPFAHWLYAYAPEHEDLLVLVNPKLELSAEAEMTFIRHNWIGPNGEAKPAEERRLMIERRDEARSAAMRAAWCYDLNELERLATRLKAVRLFLDLFGRMVTWKGAREARDLQRQTLEQCLLDLELPSLAVSGGVQTREL